MKSAKEIWLPIKEYEKYYAISNLGNVKSLQRKVKNRNGYRVVRERLLKYCYLDTYAMVKIHNKLIEVVYK